MSIGQEIRGAKTPHGHSRPSYRANPETSRDPPEPKELMALRVDPHRAARVPGSKLWRKAREGKL